MVDRAKSYRRGPVLAVLLTCLAIVLAGTAMAGELHETDRTVLGVWSSELLHDSANWPHPERDSRIEGTPAGLRVEVAAERRFAIAAMSGLGLRKDLGRIRVRVAEMGGEATWFVRLYGLRLCGNARQHRTSYRCAMHPATRLSGHGLLPLYSLSHLSLLQSVPARSRVPDRHRFRTLRFL